MFRNSISIFEEYPLILLPLNELRSHFILTAIGTEIKRKKEKSGLCPL